MTFELHPSTDKWLPNNKLKPLTVAQAGPSTFGDAVPQYLVEMRAIKHTFHPRLKNIPMWSYGPTSPGLVIEATVNTPIRVSWFNNLGKTDNLQNLLDIGDRQGMEEDHMMTVSHNVVHLHGARVPWTSDGFPEHIYHRNESHVFYYPNQQAAATLWYHDHAMDVTRLNVYAGLFGVYLLRDPLEATTLPAGDLEIPLVLQDKSFSDDGKKLHYEQTVTIAPDPDTGVRTLQAQPEFVGTYPVVNGQIWPLLELKPRVYRIRFVNGANTRFFNLSLSHETNPDSSVPLYVIGTEGGFLSAPLSTTPLLIAPGERVDVLVDLRKHNGSSLILRNDAPAPYSGDPADPRFKNPKDYVALAPDDPCAELLKIKVKGTQDPADARFDPTGPDFKLPPRIDPLPPENPPLPPMPTREHDFADIDAAINEIPIHVMEKDMNVNGFSFKLRRFKLEEYQLEMSTFPLIRVPTVQINGFSWDTAPPVSTKKNAVEVWEFVNVTPDTHPMHLHLIQFQVISRTWIDVEDDPARQTADLTEPKKAVKYLDSAILEPFETGWKDTVRCNHSQSTRLLARFDGFAGDYVYHCHILEHEDMGMMYRLNVEP